MRKILLLLTILLFFTNNNLYANDNDQKILGCFNSITKEIKEPIKGNCYLGGKYYNKWSKITLLDWQLQFINESSGSIYDKLSLIGIKSNECSDPNGLCIRNHSDFGPFQINFIHEFESRKSEFLIYLTLAKKENISLMNYLDKYNLKYKIKFIDKCKDYKINNFNTCYDIYGVKKDLDFIGYRNELFKYQMNWTLKRFKKIEKQHQCSKDKESYVKCQMWYHNGNVKEIRKGYRVADFYANKGLKVIPFILNKYNLNNKEQFLTKYQENINEVLIDNLVINGNQEKANIQSKIKNNELTGLEKELMLISKKIESKFNKEKTNIIYTKIINDVKDKYIKTGDKIYLTIFVFFNKKV